MAKIDLSAISLLNASLFKKPEAQKAKEKEELKTRKSFSEIFRSTVSASELGPLKTLAPSEEALTELMDEVHSSGSDLIDRPFHEEILRYKKAVRNFVNYVVENGYTVEKTQVRRKDRTKIYVQVQVIDQKLEELAVFILSGPTSQIKRVAKLDEIQGLLIDLTISGVIKERDE